MSVYRRFLLYLFLSCALVLMLLSSGTIESEDGWAYLSIARRIYYDGTFEMPDEVFPDNLHMGGYNWGVDGKRFGSTGLGYSLALLPAVMLEDVSYRLVGLEPDFVFPLDYDWPLVLFASMTNSVFGAAIIVGMLVILVSYGLKIRDALIISLILGFGTNLLPYFKHSFAQVMFVALFVWSFVFVRKWVVTRRKRYLVLSGAFYGGVMLSYNPTFLLLLPFFGTYFLTHIKIQQNLLITWGWWFARFKEVAAWLVGVLPFLLTYQTYNRVRFGNGLVTGYGTEPLALPAQPGLYVLFEGFWGLLFSPGKSVFLFTPLLLIPIIFWKSFKKSDMKEIVPILVLALTYLGFVSSLNSQDYLYWHGDSSFGPRYMVPIIPLVFVLVGLVFKRISKMERRIVFFPLVLLSLMISMVGVLIPYQVRFAGLESDAYLNGYRMNVQEYANLIPRFSPLFSMSKMLVKRVVALPAVYNRGMHEVRFANGFGYVNPAANILGREIQPVSQLDFESRAEEPVESILMDVSHISTVSHSTRSAQLVMWVNEVVVDEAVVDGNESIVLGSDSLSDVVVEGANSILTSYILIGTDSAKIKNQTLWLGGLRINGESQNLRSIDYPFVSDFSKKLDSGLEYSYWGNENQNLWEQWMLRGMVYENVFDFWWLKPWHYWDLPLRLFNLLLLLNLSLLGVLMFKTRSTYKRLS